MNTRRRLLIVVSTAACTPQALLGQGKKEPVLIGWLSPGTRAGNALNLAAFKEGMAAFGWKEGATYVLHERWADGQIARLPALADEIAAYKPALIVAAIVPTARAVAKVAPNTPIVLVGGDPVSSSPPRQTCGASGSSSAVTPRTLSCCRKMRAARQRNTKWKRGSRTYRVRTRSSRP